MFIFKKRKPAQVLNDLDAYLSALGTEPIELIGREIQRWGEISYSELEEIIRAGLLDEYLDWQGKYSAFVNETLNPLWTSAFLAAAERATRGKIILSDSDLDVRNWLATRGGEFITSESAASRRAIAAIVAHETENLIDPRRLARQIRPLIGLTESQSIAGRSSIGESGVALCDFTAPIPSRDDRAHRACLCLQSRSTRGSQTRNSSRLNGQMRNDLDDSGHKQSLRSLYGFERYDCRLYRRERRSNPAPSPEVPLCDKI